MFEKPIALVVVLGPGMVRSVSGEDVVILVVRPFQGRERVHTFTGGIAPGY